MGAMFKYQFMTMVTLWIHKLIEFNLILQLLSLQLTGLLNRHWLKGEKAGTTEILAENLPGMPDNIRLANVMHN